ncbi:dephospho-CoA kinase [Flagellimonas meishanensis]|uniref:dephospho-CoA kinase n=1 Tax=Flagellimonas meishanensis TaxID=2873264 RepID=UPI001CA7AC3A|nr:dephospho-CoA kinase [[Muricauda] meishanensis]
MMIVGLTGGIGSGKSTVAEMFRALGVPVYDSDAEAKLLMTSSEEIKERIISLFGKKAYGKNGLNRAYIASKAFNDRDALEKLNAIVHPAVRKHFIQWKEKQKTPYVVQESALIFENEMQHLYDLVLMVTAPEETRLERVVKRDGTSKEKVLERIKNQMDEHRKIELADFLIQNIDLESTEKKVKTLHTNLLKLAKDQF